MFELSKKTGQKNREYYEIPQENFKCCHDDGLDRRAQGRGEQGLTGTGRGCMDDDDDDCDSDRYVRHELGRHPDRRQATDCCIARAVWIRCERLAGTRAFDNQYADNDGRACWNRSYYAKACIENAAGNGQANDQQQGLRAGYANHRNFDLGPQVVREILAEP